MNKEYTDNEVLTVSEVAAYLKLSEKTVLKMAQSGEIPAAKVASQWRFQRRVIDDWLMSRMKVLPQTDLARLVEAGTDILPLSRITGNDFIVMNMRPGTKEEILRQLVQPLVRSDIITDETGLIQKLIAREQMVSTALGRGVAIPHIRHPEENPHGLPDLVVGICREGTDFGAPDREKTYLFFLLCTDSEVVHVRIMAKIATILRQQDIVTKLIAARDRDEVIRLLIEADQKTLIM